MVHAASPTVSYLTTDDIPDDGTIIEPNFDAGKVEATQDNTNLYIWGGVALAVGAVFYLTVLKK